MDLLHGLVHDDPKTLEILKRDKIFAIPMLNTDGSHKIYEKYLETGKLVLKRKNNNRSHESEKDCGDVEGGVDINRNYDYLWGEEGAADPCGGSFAGPHPFSEPESQAMRNLLTKYQDTIKFVFNFHAFGPLFIWPYNGEVDNELALSNPEALEIFTEIYDNAEMPETMLAGNAIQSINYVAYGEANDYILKAHGIPSVSPELANDNIFASTFFLPFPFLAREVLRDNHKYVLHTIEKLSG